MQKDAVDAIFQSFENTLALRQITNAVSSKSLTGISPFRLHARTRINF